MLSSEEFSEIFIAQTTRYSDYKLKCTKTGQHTVPERKDLGCFEAPVNLNYRRNNIAYVLAAAEKF